MLRIIGRALKFYLSMVFVYILCCFIAGPKNEVLCFVIISLTLGGLAVCGIILQARQR
jgi:hypothetical protein